MATKSTGSSSTLHTGGDRFHSAKTGKFVSPGYAKGHPATTFKEAPREGSKSKSK